LLGAVTLLEVVDALHYDAAEPALTYDGELTLGNQLPDGARIVGEQLSR
jgi:hypothetical protein